MGTQMLDVHESQCRPGPLSFVCMLLLMAVASKAIASESSRQILATDISHTVISSLPKSNGQSASITANLDLTHPFETRTQWTFVAAILPGSHFDGADTEPVDGGPLAQCFVNDLTSHCTYKTPTNDSDWFSTPIELYLAEIVFRGANSTRPLLMIQTGSAHGGDGGHSIYTELFTYDRRSDKFKSVFSNATGSNNNQKTRFIDAGPLRGDVIVDEPAGCCYRIAVYQLGASGSYASILVYRSHTVYGDGNPLSVSDSEMPEILRRLGLWHEGDALPIPREGCTPVMLRGEEWCRKS
jgi:hypothetical protein